MKVSQVSHRAFGQLWNVNSIVVYIKILVEISNDI